MKKTKRGIEVASEWTPRSRDKSHPKWVPYETEFNEEFSYDSLEDLRLSDFDSSNDYQPPTQSNKAYSKKNRHHNDNKNNNLSNDDFEVSKQRSKSLGTSDKNQNNPSMDIDHETSDLSDSCDDFNPLDGNRPTTANLAAGDNKHQNSGHKIPPSENCHNKNHYHKDDNKDTLQGEFHSLKRKESSILTDKNYSDDRATDEESLEISDVEDDFSFYDENQSTNNRNYTCDDGDGEPTDHSIHSSFSQRPDTASDNYEVKIPLKQKISKETLNAFNSFKNLMSLLFSAEAVLLIVSSLCLGFERFLMLFYPSKAMAARLVIFLLLCVFWCVELC